MAGTANSVSLPTLRRLPIYLHYLNAIKAERRNISATAIAEHFGINPVQVRKDLGIISGSGKPKTGYVVEELIDQLTECLDCNNETDAVLVGAGNLGHALLHYHGFEDYGLKIIAAFDVNPEICGTLIGDTPIYPIDSIERICAKLNPKLGIITVPLSCAQSTCDMLCKSGIKAILNFSPVILRAPKGILIENENLASSLAILSRHLSEAKEDDK